MEEIINYNNFDYILVNDKNINGKRIYHFFKYENGRLSNWW